MKKGNLRTCFRVGYDHSFRRLDLLDDGKSFRKMHEEFEENARVMSSLSPNFLGWTFYVLGKVVGEHVHDSFKCVDYDWRQIHEAAFNEYFLERAR